MVNIFYAVGIPAIIMAIIFGAVKFQNVIEEAKATGGAGEIKGLIDPMLDRAIEALQNNNTELALEEIETVKNELEDTFSADENEDDED